MIKKRKQLITMIPTPTKDLRGLFGVRSGAALGLSGLSHGQDFGISGFTAPNPNAPKRNLPIA